MPVALAVMMLAAPLTRSGRKPPKMPARRTPNKRARRWTPWCRHWAAQAWLNMKNQMREGHVAAFFHGKPSGGTTEYWEYHAWPDHDRIEFTKHRDVVQFYMGRAGTEVTYKGKAPLPQEQVEDFLRRRDHSIETVIKVWLNDPKNDPDLRGPAPGRAPSGRPGDADFR